MNDQYKNQNLEDLQDDPFVGVEVLAQMPLNQSKKKTTMKNNTKPINNSDFFVIRGALLTIKAEVNHRDFVFKVGRHNLSGTIHDYKRGLRIDITDHSSGDKCTHYVYQDIDKETSLSIRNFLTSLMSRVIRKNHLINGSDRYSLVRYQNGKRKIIEVSEDYGSLLRRMEIAAEKYIEYGYRLDRHRDDSISLSNGTSCIRLILVKENQHAR